MTRLVFFYGLFMDPEVLRKLGVETHGPRLATVRGKALRIGERATLVDDPDDEVHGVVMALSASDLEALYSAPNVAAYRPGAVTAHYADGSSVAAITYVLPHADGARANPDYVFKLKSVAAKMGLPDDYLAKI